VNNRNMKKDSGAKASDDGHERGEDSQSERDAQPNSGTGDSSPPVDDSQVLEAGVPTDAQAAEYLAGWQRERAEYANYKKRVERERIQWQDIIRSDLVLNLLPVIDDFERAVENLPEEGPARDWANGILLIHRKLKQQLEDLGLEEIDAVGHEFDPEMHEAVTHEPSSEHDSGKVIGVLRRGYRLGDKIVRPALVRVAS
jgi:molecular chaperone GrpE